MFHDFVFLACKGQFQSSVQKLLLMNHFKTIVLGRIFDDKWSMQVADCCETLVGSLFKFEKTNADNEFLFCLLCL